MRNRREAGRGPRRAAASVLAASLLAAFPLAPAAGAQDAAQALPTPPPVTVTVADERPLRDQAVRVTVAEGPAPAAGYEVKAVYRPNSSTSYVETVGASDAAGTIFWSPRDAGPVTLEVRPPGGAADATAAAATTVAVRFGELPVGGLGMMVLAGLLLFGGAAAGFAMLLRPPSQAPADEPPST